MRTVQPVFCKLNDSGVHVTFEVFDLKVIAVMLLCEFAVRKATLHIMPPFTPTEEMLDIHADKG